ncbi:hypothetical protein DENSPDRAFT_658069 [Dentipellis sp. KUC8613]|nr:hypothetical protein DENSPDRAFT_658069 [Dentipellis sp. KUC8613]
MLLEAPTDAGREYLAEEVARCYVDRALQGLGGVYFDHLLRCFFRDKNTDIFPRSLLEEPVVGLIDIAQDVDLGALSATPPTSCLTAKRKALSCDGYRCMLSKKLDLEVLQQNLFLDDGNEVMTTRCAHILVCLYEGLEDSVNTACAASAYAVFDPYGGISYDHELDPRRVHGLGNGLTLIPDLYDSFSQLNI